MKKKELQLMGTLIEKYIGEEIKTIMFNDQCELEDVDILQIIEGFNDEIRNEYQDEEFGEIKIREGAEGIIIRDQDE